MRFEKGLSIAMTRLKRSEYSYAGFKHLLLIAAKIRAYTILEVLPELIGSGFWGYDLECNDDDLYIVALDTVASLTTRNEEYKAQVLECLNVLISSKNFKLRPLYSDTAFLCLCLADPDSYPKHLKKLRPLMTEVFDKFELKEVHKYNLARNFLQRMSLSKVVECLNQLELSSNKDESFTDVWFFKALFEYSGVVDQQGKKRETEPLLSFTVHDDYSGEYQFEVTIFSTNNPARSYPILLNYEKNRRSMEWLKIYFLDQDDDSWPEEAKNGFRPLAAVV